MTVLELGSDLTLRNKYFTAASMAHPAKLHLGVLQWVVEKYTQPGETIADPMAGIGSTLFAATLQRNVIAREIEPRWLAYCHENAAHILYEAGLFAGTINIGSHDARQTWGYTADHLIFSPPYGCASSTNTTSRHYVSHKTYKMAKEQGIGYTERWLKFVNTPSPGAAGSMTFFYGEHPAQMGAFRGERYWAAMRDIYTNAYAALGSGYMILILKDHIKRGQRVTVSDTTIELCRAVGFRFVERHQRQVWPMSLWQRRRKERGEPVVEEEDVLVFTKGCAA